MTRRTTTRHARTASTTQMRPRWRRRFRRDDDLDILSESGQQAHQALAREVREVTAHGSVARRGWGIARCSAGTALAIPQRVLPPVGQAVVAAHGTLPH